MNYWSTGQIPYSWLPKSVTLKWSGMDHIESYNKNPRKSDWDNVNLSYQYNPQGFRCPDLNNFLGKPVNIALGCSFTEGVGLPVESAWPSLIEQQVEHPVLNLGLGGGSTDAVARVLTNVSGLFDIQTVYILWPPLHRLECYKVFDESYTLITQKVYKNGQPIEPKTKIHKVETVYPMDSSLEHVWALSDEMNSQRLNRNMLTVDLLAQNFGYQIKQITVDGIIPRVRNKPLEELDFARDGVHWGIETQKEIAKLLLDN